MHNVTMCVLKPRPPKVKTARALYPYPGVICTSWSVLRSALAGATEAGGAALRQTLLQRHALRLLLPHGVRGHRCQLLVQHL